MRSAMTCSSADSPEEEKSTAHIGRDTVIVSAMLGELVSSKKLLMSEMKVGRSRLYYVSGDEEKLENFSQHLNEKDKETYEKLHKSRKSEKVESARNLLELLLENRQGEEQRIASEMSRFKKDKNIPYLEDAKKSIFARKSQYQSEITKSKLEQIKITTLLKQFHNVKNQRYQFGSYHSVGRQRGYTWARDKQGNAYKVALPAGDPGGEHE